MKTLLYILISSIFLISCNSANTKNGDSPTTAVTEPQHSDDEQTTKYPMPDDIVYLGFSDETLLDSSNMEDISENEYDKYKKIYRTKFITDSSYIHTNPTKDSIAIKVMGKQVVYPTFDIMTNTDKYPKWWVQYKGYIPDLRLYILEDWGSGEMLIGASTWVDSLTNIHYLMDSGTDGPVSPPIVSPDNKFLVFFTTYEYSDNIPSVFIIKINNENGIYSYANYSSLKLNNSADDNNEKSCSEVIWADDKTFLLKIETNDNNFCYKRVTIKEEK
ncbi:hypothetical protein [Dysgonomonas sp. 520]|uniref:hypothetical protein n=1 Tax=Dysgonomonas sp. 520 TaxID=2302931 RepID=UPI0013D4A185|nr:hypothetical protein [Dysgonomonas sp. 520]NDW09470.1 hypothetical protein [Dysgonomonas sp. 520]